MYTYMYIYIYISKIVYIQCRFTQTLTHWGRVTHICVGNLTIIDSDNGLSPGRRQAIVWTNVGILLIEPLRTNFSQILTEIQAFSFKKMHVKMSPARRRPFCLGLNVLTHWERDQMAPISQTSPSAFSWMKTFEFSPEAIIGLRVLPLPASVRPSVTKIVRAITHHQLKLRSPNLDHRCKRHWLRSLWFWGVIDLDLQGQTQLQSKNLPHFELVRPITHHPFKLRPLNLDQRC